MAAAGWEAERRPAVQMCGWAPRGSGKLSWGLFSFCSELGTTHGLPPREGPHAARGRSMQPLCHLGHAPAPADSAQWGLRPHWTALRGAWDTSSHLGSCTPTAQAVSWPPGLPATHPSLVSSQSHPEPLGGRGRTRSGRGWQKGSRQEACARPLVGGWGGGSAACAWCSGLRARPVP